MPRQLKFAPDSEERVFIEEDQVRAVSPEGKQASMKLGEMLERAVPRKIDTGEVILPDGVKAVRQTACGLVVVHQTPPRPWSFKWIAEDSPARWGPGTKYRTVRLALPYLVVLAVFEEGPRGALLLSGRNECFFTNEPLDRAGMETKLCYPALLNCSRLPSDPGNNLAWVCTQHLDRSVLLGLPDIASAVRVGLGALLQHLLETGFNYSSEDHELNSWYSETVAAGVDERISSIPAWEAASAANPVFALDVPWLDTGQSLGQIVGRIVDLYAGQRPAPTHAGDIARIVLNGTRRRRGA